LDVDGFIVRQNVQRASVGGADTAHLAGLSDDAAPALFAAFDDSRLPGNLHDDLGASLACRSAEKGQEQSSPLPWPSYHWSSARAGRLFADHQESLAAYPVYTAPDGWKVKVNGVFRPCPAASDRLTKFYR
jgi:hypothetical protein